MLLTTTSAITREITTAECTQIVPRCSTGFWSMSPSGYWPVSSVPPAVHGVGSHPGIIFGLTPVVDPSSPPLTQGVPLGRFTSPVGMPRNCPFPTSRLSLPGVPRPAAVKPPISAGRWKEDTEYSAAGKEVLLGVIDPEGNVIKHGTRLLDSWFHQDIS
jgi:hypothetical protein